MPSRAADAAVVTPFAKRFSVNTSGAIRLTGNTLMTRSASDSRCADALAGRGSTLNDNNFRMERVDVDDDSTTFTSSDAQLDLPAGATILYAVLYGGADTSAGVGGSAAPNPPARDRVLLAVPGSGYTEIRADRMSASGGDFSRSVMEPSEQC